MKTQRKLGWLAALAAAAFLGGCSGSDDSPAPAATTQVPPSASQSSAGLVAYIQALAREQADDKEPVDLSTFTPPTPDNTEPESLS